MTFTKADMKWAEKIIAELRKELSGVILDQPEMVLAIIRAVVSSQHLLIKGIPGLGKTEIIRAIVAGLIGELTYGWVQGSRELLPSDITGAHYRQADGTYVFRPGPVRNNILVLDEVNRTHGRNHSTLLQAMQNRVIIAQGPTEETVRMPQLFSVVATMNPIEQEAVYPLPEALKDRFMEMIVVDVPKQSTRENILAMNGKRPGGEPEVREVLKDLEELEKLQLIMYDITVSPEMVKYISFITASFDPDMHPVLGVGMSPRGDESIMTASRFIAMSEGSGVVKKEHIDEIVVSTLRHRVILNVSESRKIKNFDVDSFIKERRDEAWVESQK